jgi:RNA polymerase sigma-B factor
MPYASLPHVSPRLDLVTATDERLLVLYHRDGDALARDEFVRRAMPLARRLASRYRVHGHHEDMDQVAAIGLIKAVDGFDPERGVRFTTYAIPKILGELRRHVRDHAYAVHVPRPLKDRAVQVQSTTRTLAARLGRSPRIGEIARELSLEREQVIEAISTRRAIGADSLDARRFGGEDGDRTYAETIGAEDPGLDIDHAPALSRTIRSMPVRDRVILHLRFVEDLTQAEIADQLGISQMHVSRLLRRSLRRLEPVTGLKAA